MKSLKNDQSGFTLAELMVVVTVGAALSLTILSISLFFFADVLRARTQSELTSEARNINSLIVEDLRTANAIQTVALNPDDNQPVEGWSTSNANLVLIVSTPAQNDDGEFVIDPVFGDLFLDEFVYFVSEDDGSLYKRTLTNPDFADNASSRTCPASMVTPTCPQDSLLSENFADMSFTFFDQDNFLVTNPSLARSIQLDILMQRVSFGVDIEANNIARVTMRNPT